MSISPTSRTCRNCGTAFPFRSNKTSCSASCRKALSQRERRKALPVNAANYGSIRREQHEVFELAMRMAESLYSMPPFDRLGYLEEVVQLARTGQSPKIRKILTMPTLLRPSPDKKHLFYRGCRGHCTMSQAADRYCRMSPWNAGVVQVVRGEVPDPPTGEVIEGLVNIAA